MTQYPMSEGAHSGFILTEDGISSCLALREDGRSYDLLERTSRFGEAVIRLVKKLPDNAVNHRLISQVVGAATSIGANYCKADEASSKKDFCQKISLCRKEATETLFFLRMLATAEQSCTSEARQLYREARELHLIFCAIHRNSKGASYR